MGQDFFTTVNHYCMVGHTGYFWSYNFSSSIFLSRTTDGYLRVEQWVVFWIDRKYCISVKVFSVYDFSVF